MIVNIRQTRVHLLPAGVIRVLRVKRAKPTLRGPTGLLNYWLCIGGHVVARADTAEAAYSTWLTVSGETQCTVGWVSLAYVQEGAK